MEIISSNSYSGKRLLKALDKLNYAKRYFTSPGNLRVRRKNLECFKAFASLRLLSPSTNTNDLRLDLANQFLLSLLKL